MEEGCCSFPFSLILSVFLLAGGASALYQDRQCLEKALPSYKHHHSIRTGSSCKSQPSQTRTERDGKMTVGELTKCHCKTQEPFRNCQVKQSLNNYQDILFMVISLIFLFKCSVPSVKSQAGLGEQCIEAGRGQTHTVQTQSYSVTH